MKIASLPHESVQKLYVAPVRLTLLAILLRRSLFIDSKHGGSRTMAAGIRKAQPVLIHFSLECSERVSPVCFVEACSAGGGRFDRIPAAAGWPWAV